MFPVFVFVLKFHFRIDGLCFIKAFLEFVSRPVHFSQFGMCVIQDFPTCGETAGNMLILFSKLIGLIFILFGTVF